MKVLFVTASYPTPDEHAVGIFVKEHARAAAAAHCDVAVLHLDRSDTRGVAVAEVEGEEFPTFRVRYPESPPLLSYAANVVGAAAGYRRVRRLGFDPDVIHAHFFLAGAPAVLLGKATHKPVVVTEQWSVFLPDDPATLSPIVWRAARFAFEQAHAVLPVSEALRDGIAATGIHARFRIVPNVVDVARFHPPPEPVSTNSAPARLLSVGALYEAKGWEYLLEAVALLARSRSDFHLDIVGDGPLREEYERTRRRLGIESHVTFTGWRTKDEVADLMRAADTFVLSSRYDSNPCALIEALASGLPVVATHVGGIPEMVPPDAGTLVPPRDPGRLAEALSATLDNRVHYDRAAIAAQARARYGADEVGRKLMSIYQDVLARR
jgi:glycosyltransferase involved in cell wall biosynthesis